MPFTIGQILDLLMIVVLIMFIPIGLWRGALREWIALVGITLGMLLADEWAGPWGGDLAAQTNLGARMAAFIVGTAFFLGATLLIGYGGGAALPFRPDLSRSNRLLGALLGVGNGALILSGTLRIMQRHLFEGRADSLLRGTILSRLLIDDVGWAELVLLVALLGCVVVSLLRRWAGGPPLMEEFARPYPASHPAQAASGDAAWEPHPAGEVWTDEAPSEDTAPPAVAARAQGDTAVLHVLPQPAARPPSPPPTPPAPSPRATALVSVPRVVDIARPNRPGPATAAGAPGLGRANGQTPANGAPPAGPGSPTLAAPGGRAARPLTCPVCANEVAARSRFCHHCGHIIGEAERRRVARHD